MKLPKYVVLKSMYNKKYLSYRDEQGEEQHGFLQFSEDNPTSPYSKLEVKPSTTGKGLIHLKCTFNNKYLVRKSSTHYWIRGSGSRSEEDRSKWSCTLFKPVLVDDHNGDGNLTVRFLHVQLNHYACLFRSGPPFGDCLYAGWDTPNQDLCDACSVIDWDLASRIRIPKRLGNKPLVLPKFVVIKSRYNNKYLRYRNEPGEQHGFLQFSGDDDDDKAVVAANRYTKFEVRKAKSGDGMVHLKCCYNNKYLVRSSSSQWWIRASANGMEEDESKWSCTLFKPVYFDNGGGNSTPLMVRFLHIELGHYACLFRSGQPFGDCLYAGWEGPNQDLCDVCTITDWDSLGKEEEEDKDDGDVTGQSVEDEDEEEELEVTHPPGRKTNNPQAGSSTKASHGSSSSTPIDKYVRDEGKDRNIGKNSAQQSRAGNVNRGNNNAYKGKGHGKGEDDGDSSEEASESKNNQSSNKNYGTQTRSGNASHGNNAAKKKHDPNEDNTTQPIPRPSKPNQRSPAGVRDEDEDEQGGGYRSAEAKCPGTRHHEANTQQPNFGNASRHGNTRAPKNNYDDGDDEGYKYNAGHRSAEDQKNTTSDARHGDEGYNNAGYRSADDRRNQGYNNNAGYRSAEDWRYTNRPRWDDQGYYNNVGYRSAEEINNTNRPRSDDDTYYNNVGYRSAEERGSTRNNQHGEGTSNNTRHGYGEAKADDISNFYKNFTDRKREVAEDERGEKEFTVVSSANTFWGAVFASTKILPKALPELYTKITVVAGDGFTEGSIRDISFPGGKKTAWETLREQIVLVDHEKKKITWSILEGGMLDYYDSFKITVSVKPRGRGSRVKMSYHGTNPKEDSFFNKEDFKKFFEMTFEDVDSYLEKMPLRETV